jgi:hypothetical protein
MSKMIETLTLRNVMTGEERKVELELEAKPSAWQKPFDYIVWWYKRRLEYAFLNITSPRMGYSEATGGELRIYEGFRDWAVGMKPCPMPMYRVQIFRRMARELAFREKIYGVKD